MGAQDRKCFYEEAWEAGLSPPGYHRPLTKTHPWRHEYSRSFLENKGKGKGFIIDGEFLPEDDDDTYARERERESKIRRPVILTQIFRGDMKIAKEGGIDTSRTKPRTEMCSLSKNPVERIVQGELRFYGGLLMWTR